MKQLLFSFILLSFVICAKAQNSPPDIPELDKAEVKDSTGSSRHIFTSVELAPSFRGGIDNFYKYIGFNLRYPENAFKNKIEGKVDISFVVGRDGRLTQIKIIKGVSPDIDAEAIRLIKDSPRWNPGIQNGIAVSASYAISISFKISLPKN